MQKSLSPSQRLSKRIERLGVEDVFIEPYSPLLRRECISQFGAEGTKDGELIQINCVNTITDCLSYPAASATLKNDGAYWWYKP